MVYDKYCGGVNRHQQLDKRGRILFKNNQQEPLKRLKSKRGIPYDSLRKHSSGRDKKDFNKVESKKTAGILAIAGLVR